jgi:hypothetical protein
VGSCRGRRERVRFALEIGLRLPRRAEVLLELPLQLLRDFDAQLRLVGVDDRNDRATAKLPSSGRLTFGPALVPAKARYEMRFLVTLNSADRDAVFALDARQLYEGKQEVGRLSWRFDTHAKERREKIRALG